MKNLFLAFVSVFLFAFLNLFSIAAAESPMHSDEYQQEMNTLDFEQNGPIDFDEEARQMDEAEEDDSNRNEDQDFMGEPIPQIEGEEEHPENEMEQEKDDEEDSLEDNKS